MHDQNFQTYQKQEALQFHIFFTKAFSSWSLLYCTWGVSVLINMAYTLMVDNPTAPKPGDYLVMQD